jgi:hypothetical protein
VADTVLQKTAETAAGEGVPAPLAGASPPAKVRGRPFRKGQSGNPTGRPRGSVNSATRAAMLLLDSEAETLTRKAVELALAGDPVALRLCLDRVLGARRGRPVDLPGAAGLPAVEDARDLATAMTAVMAAAAQGNITPDEALLLAQTAESCARTLEAAHVARKRFWRSIFFRPQLTRHGRTVRLTWYGPPAPGFPATPSRIADTIRQRRGGWKGG